MHYKNFYRFQIARKKISENEIRTHDIWDMIPSF